MFSFSYERLNRLDMEYEYITEGLGYDCVCGGHDSYGGRQYDVGSKYNSLIDCQTQGQDTSTRIFDTVNSYSNAYLLEENLRYRLQEDLEYTCDRVYDEQQQYGGYLQGSHNGGYHLEEATSRNYDGRNFETYQNFDIGQNYEDGVDFSKVLQVLDEYRGNISGNEYSGTGGGGCCCKACSTGQGMAYRTTYNDHYRIGGSAEQVSKPSKKLSDRCIYDIG